MLGKVDLSKRMEKRAYKAVIGDLQNRLYLAQKATWDSGLPVIILFEGWDASGKGTSIQQLTACLDPRGFIIYPIRAPRSYEKKYPWMWRYWLKIPARGEWAIFDRSWYGRVLVERVEGLTPENEWRRGYRDIVDFERMLSEDGYKIFKFFLHISKAEQKRRFAKLSKDPLEEWHVSAEDWDHHRRYEDWLQAYEEAFDHTDNEWGPWTIIEATDRRYTWFKIQYTLLQVLEESLGLGHRPLVGWQEVMKVEAPEAEEDIDEIQENEDGDGEVGPEGELDEEVARVQAALAEEDIDETGT